VSGGEAITLRIMPKVPIARLFFLLGYALNPKGWRDETVEVAEHAGLVPALAHAFERQVERVLRQGVLQGYRVTEETSLLVRGRIREADQIRRHYGLTLPVGISYDEYTVDIPENQLLRTATERLLRLPDIPAPSGAASCTTELASPTSPHSCAAMRCPFGGRPASTPVTTVPCTWRGPSCATPPPSTRLEASASTASCST
jgi:hypothetical protein